jgi:sugar lactone lactonase YvrE
VSRPEVRQASGVRSLVGESPFWHPLEQALYYCDVAGRRLHRLDPASGAEQSWGFDTELACCAPIHSGGLLLARRDGLFRFDPATGASSLICAAPYPDPSIERFNDGKCDMAGRFWCGTLYEPRTSPLAALYCLDLGVVQRRADGVTNSNGLAFSPDGHTMYWADTKQHAVFALDSDPVTGSIGERRVLARFDLRNENQPLESYGGRPDGAAVDSQGNYWSALFEGSRLVQLSPDGAVLQEIALPVRCPTMPCFGGADLKTIYVTSASFQRPQAERDAQPMSGHVLAFDVDVPGLPCRFYRDRGA